MDRSGKPSDARAKVFAIIAALFAAAALVMYLTGLNWLTLGPAGAAVVFGVLSTREFRIYRDLLWVWQLRQPNWRQS